MPKRTSRSDGPQGEPRDAANQSALDAAKQQQIDSRHPWRSPYGPPPAFAFAVLQTQSGSYAGKPAQAPE
jgi:hypothetical protein